MMASLAAAAVPPGYSMISLLFGHQSLEWCKLTSEYWKITKSTPLKQSSNGPVKACCCGPVIVLGLYWNCWLLHTSTALLTWSSLPCADNGISSESRVGRGWMAGASGAWAYTNLVTTQGDEARSDRRRRGLAADPQHAAKVEALEIEAANLGVIVVRRQHGCAYRRAQQLCARMGSRRERARPCSVCESKPVRMKLPSMLGYVWYRAYRVQED